MFYITLTVLQQHGPAPRQQPAADWSTQSHTWTEPSEAADSSVRGRSGCHAWAATKTPGGEETAWPRCSNSGSTSRGAAVQSAVS